MFVIPSGESECLDYDGKARELVDMMQGPMLCIMEFKLLLPSLHHPHRAAACHQLSGSSAPLQHQLSELQRPSSIIEPPHSWDSACSCNGGAGWLMGVQFPTVALIHSSASSTHLSSLNGNF